MTTVTDRAGSALMAALAYSAGDLSGNGVKGGNSAGSPLSNALKNPSNTQLLDSTLKLMSQTLNAASKVLEQASKLLSQADQMGGGHSPHGASNGNPGCFPTTKPSSSPSESGWGGGFQDKPTLKTDKDGKITTPGGYTIEPMGQFEWKVTGPDKKETRVWGDPHVQESDGGSWDFKKNTEFKLGDGTSINVSCVPYGNGATVTGQLDIVNGDSHVSVTDIDKGKGKTGEVKNDGNSELFRFGMSAGPGESVNHVTMGKTTADWNFEGHEIVGSEKQGEILKTKTEAGVDGHVQDNPNWNSTLNNGGKTQDALSNLTKVFDSLTKLFGQMDKTQSGGFNPFRRADDFGKYNRQEHGDGLKHAFKSLHNMLHTLHKQFELSGMLRQRGTNIS